MTRPTPRRSRLAGASPIAPPVPDQDLEDVPQAEPEESASAPVEPAAPVSATTPKSQATTRAAAPRSGQSETARLGVYLPTEEFDDARAAYMADWNHGGTADTFASWLAGAVDEHARLSVKERKSRTQLRGRADERSGITRSFNVPAASVARMRAAITADREEAGQFLSDSAWCREAIRNAVEKARTRNGGSLPTPPPRLPNRLVR